MVSTWRPSAWPASIRQALTAWPSTITVQAPQSPTSQPSLAPVRLKFSRNSWSSVVSGGTEALRVSPLTVIVTSVTPRAPFPSRSRAPARWPSARFTSTAIKIAPVSGAGAEIADRLRFGRGDAAGFGHRLGADRAAFEIGFRLAARG